MKDSVVNKLASALAKTRTSHNNGEKIILLKNEETESLLTQTAIGILQPGETVEPHVHSDMEEFFYFLEGKGSYIIDNKTYTLQATSFIKIPIGKIHELKAEGNVPLKFIYWGIAVE
ncbi:cupin domain-containing protein [Chondrinema litorale]|uniref:cupin domain-containing protein n=1 Tax=Chondrinema litorale TaxID=2994555 RepID=UPI002542A2CA|nr:cupin domain-containing protein [Chondrinema litorale]UZR96235.1 cupin domain-containing protein [Chondrinema litorale]